MTAKEWIFENYPQVKKEWNKTGHDDNYMVRMMEEYHQAKLKLLGMRDDVKQSEQLVCEECKEPMVEPYAERYGKKFCLGCM
jgi:formylmethanofuran dehydrogenase subunit E